MDFWDYLAEQNIMWGDAARYCGVGPGDVLHWWIHGVPDGMLEQVKEKVDALKGSDHFQ